jgi:hypothetical protein
MQFDEVLRTWKAFFEREGVRYVVIGGLAVRVWGRARFTNDVDLAVTRSDAARVVAHAEDLGYETLFVSTAYSNHLHPDRRFGRLDFMFVDDDTGRPLFDSAVQRAVVGGVEAPVARPEYLAMMKAVAMKNAPIRALYEGEDIRVLLNVPGVDHKLVRDYFQQIGMLELYDAIDKAR